MLRKKVSILSSAKILGDYVILKTLKKPKENRQDIISTAAANSVMQRRNSGPDQTFLSPNSQQLKQLQSILPENSRMNNQKAIQAKADKFIAQSPNPVQKKEKKGGLPATLQSGIEKLSGQSMNDVQVHYNSDKPAQLQAHAYAQGNQIHLASGQEKHLPHEAWHIVQQKQGRVKPTLQMKGNVKINDDIRLEKEADQMGAKAIQMKTAEVQTPPKLPELENSNQNSPVQRALATDADILKEKTNTFNWTSFRGKRVDAGHGKATETGRGAKLSTGESRSTSVRWGALDGVAHEGTFMEARVGPDHNLGSPPSAKIAVNRVAAFAALSRQTYISGHLMNEKLGGPGNDGRNLTAISQTANSLQASNIEQFVRDPVNENGAWMYYKVQVTYSDHQVVKPSNDQHLLTALSKQAPGIAVTAIGTTGNSTVKVRYASKLSAQWYPMDIDGGMAKKARNISVSIQSPLAGGGAQVANDGKTGQKTGKAAVKTTILPEELVLTKSDLLKHIVLSRAPLSLRIRQLKDNIEALEGSEHELNQAKELLVLQMKTLGSKAGFNLGFTQELAQKGHTAHFPDLDIVPEEPYQAAFSLGVKEGKKAGEEYNKGFDDGKERGWSDEGKLYLSQSVYYKSGYDKGHKDGLDAGDYSAGKRYAFNSISVLNNIHEYQSNVFRHLQGGLTLELTGEKFIQGNGPRWYQVKLVLAGDHRLNGELGQVLGWMKRKWLNKGF